MTDMRLKPPPWAVTDEWHLMPPEARACYLHFLCGVQYALEGRDLPSYPRPPREGDLVR